MSTVFFEELKDKVCVITGGAGVIGISLAKGLASAGVKTVILDLNNELAGKAAAEVKNHSGTESIGVEANVLIKESLENAKKTVNEKLGKVDILINCAGGNSPKATTQLEFLSKEIDLNFLGTVLPTMVFTKDMIDSGKGSIINISSMNAFRPLTKIPAYSAAKASINNLTEWLAVHFAGVNIRVNGIAPGFFLTNQNRFLLMDEKTNQLTPRGNKIISNTPMGRFGEPDELQGTLLYLVSDLSKFVTGVIIPIDGGFNAFSGV
jgi:NAD(P)-dependent dehydrogenase (short-subunit alcohol dehydrogenase family)